MTERFTLTGTDPLLSRLESRAEKILAQAGEDPVLREFSMDVMEAASLLRAYEEWHQVQLEDV